MEPKRLVPWSIQADSLSVHAPPPRVSAAHACELVGAESEPLWVSADLRFRPERVERRSYYVFFFNSML